MKKGDTNVVALYFILFYFCLYVCVCFLFCWFGFSCKSSWSVIMMHWAVLMAWWNHAWPCLFVSFFLTLVLQFELFVHAFRSFACLLACTVFCVVRVCCCYCCYCCCFWCQSAANVQKRNDEEEVMISESIF